MACLERSRLLRSRVRWYLTGVSLGRAVCGMSGGGARRLSGLQRQVLSLARSVARAARVKPPTVRAAVMARLRQEFEAGQAVDRLDVGRIEHLLRKGGRQLELLRSGAVVGVSQWGAGHTDKPT